MKKRRHSYLDKRMKKGKYYAIIDYLFMITFSLFSLYLLKKLEYPDINSGRKVISYKEFILSLFFMIHFIFAIIKTKASNRNVMISNKKKYIVGGYYPIIIVLACFLVFVYVYVDSNFYQQTNVYITIFLFQYLITLLFSLIRWILAFDYYQSYYYQNKKSYAGYLYIWGISSFVVLLILVTIFEFILFIMN